MIKKREEGDPTNFFCRCLRLFYPRVEKSLQHNKLECLNPVGKIQFSIRC
jgi:hypothetical protein